jgi:hypothetical protein
MEEKKMLNKWMYASSVIVGIMIIIGNEFCKPLHVWSTNHGYYISHQPVPFRAFLYDLEWWYFLPFLAFAIILSVIGHVKYGSERELPSEIFQIIPMRYGSSKEPATLFDDGNQFVMYVKDNKGHIEKLRIDDDATIIFGNTPRAKRSNYGPTDKEKKIFWCDDWCEWEITIPENAAIVRTAISCDNDCDDDDDSAALAASAAMIASSAAAVNAINRR